jgi:hypothetical protein
VTASINSVNSISVATVVNDETTSLYLFFDNGEAINSQALMLTSTTPDLAYWAPSRRTAYNEVSSVNNTVVNRASAGVFRNEIYVFYTLPSTDVTDPLGMRVQVASGV